MKYAIAMLVLLFLGCGKPVPIGPDGIIDNGHNTDDTVIGSKNHFSVQISTTDYSDWYSANLNFNTNNITINVISAQTVISGNVQLRLYSANGEMITSRTMDVNGDFVESLSLSLSAIPHKVELDFNGYSGMMTLEIQGN